MSRAKFWLGALWASPVTLVVLLFYVLPFTAFGWYRYTGRRELAWVYVMTDKAPGFVKSLWGHWGGQAMGNVIVFKRDPDMASRADVARVKHEMTHVLQCMYLGPFAPVAYFSIFLVGKVFERFVGRFDAYHDHPFELHARRCAGQVVDVVGLVEKVKSTQYTKG